MRCPLLSLLYKRLPHSRTLLLFVLVNLPALLLLFWLGLQFYSQVIHYQQLDLSEAVTAGFLVALLGGLVGNLLLFRGVTGVSARLAESLDQCAAQKAQLEAIHAAREQFLIRLNHEIRTPLNGILGMAQVLALNQQPPEQAQQLETLRHSAERLAGLLEGMLRGWENQTGTHTTLLLAAEPSERERLAKLLREAGCCVVAVADEQAGMAELVRGMVEGAPFTLVVVAESMPSANTSDWLQQLHASPTPCRSIVLPCDSSAEQLREALAQIWQKP